MARIGGAGPIFGTTDKTYGIFQSVDEATAVEEFPVPRGDGEVYAVEQFGKTIAYSFEYTYITTGGPDEDDVGTGVAVTLTNPKGVEKTAYVKSITDRASIGAMVVVSGEATNWPFLDTLSS